jgi:uncharacterized protein
MMPVRRDLHFSLPPERVLDWHELGPHVTHFFNALSLLFPAGERFFMDSVRHYRDQIDDPVLKKQVQGFIGQEAMHTREHMAYNERLDAAGLPAHKLDKRLWAILGWQKKHLSPAFNLGVTVAAEHYTAMLAELILSDPSRLGASVDTYVKVWTWHALEETEHKGVSFDVWNHVMPPGIRRYLLRSGTMLITTLGFWLIVFEYHTRLLMADSTIKGKLRGVGSIVTFLFGRKGVFPGIAREWLAFFKPGFHPWDFDNRGHLTRIDAMIEAANTQAS